MKILPSKLTLPNLSKHVIERPHLTNGILSRHQPRLCMIIAPAGCGKTVLAQQVLRRVRHGCRCWYHLDDEDINPVRFLTYLSATLASANSAFKNSGLFSEDSGPIDFLERVENICYFFSEYQGPECWLVLDNFEKIDSNKDICTAVGKLVEHTCGKLRVVITARRMPPIKTCRWVESEQAVLITEDQLRLDFDDLSRAFERHLGHVPDASQMAILWDLSQGWCVSIGLLSRLARRHGIEGLTEVVGSAARRDILRQYIEEELFSDFDAEFSDFLARCSVLDTITPEGARAVMEGDSNINEMMAVLRESDIPQEELSENSSIRLHPLVRRASNGLLRQTLPKEQLTQLYKALSDYYIQSGLVAEAVETLMDIPEPLNALQFIDKQLHSIINTYGVEQLITWLDRLRIHVGDNLLYIRLRGAVLLETGRVKELAEYLAGVVALDNFSVGDNLRVDLWRRYRMSLTDLSNKPMYEQMSEEWAIIRDRFGPFDADVCMPVENAFAFAAYRELRLIEAVEHVDRFIEYLKESNSPGRLIMRNNKAIIMHSMGETSEAESQLENIIHEAEQKNNFNVIPLALVNKTEICLTSGRFTEVIALAHKVEECMESYATFNREIAASTSLYKGVALWYLGNHEEGLRILYDGLKNTIAYNPSATVTVKILIEYFEFLGGRTVNLIDESGIPRATCEERLYYLAKEAYISLSQRDLERQLSLASELFNTTSQCGIVAWNITARLLLAYHAKLSNNLESCRKQVTETLNIMATHGWHSYPMANADLTSFAVSEGIKSGGLTDGVRRLCEGDMIINLSARFKSELLSNDTTVIEKRNLLLASKELGVQGLLSPAQQLTGHCDKNLGRAATEYVTKTESALLPPLKITTLGRFVTLAGGQRLVFGRKKSKYMFLLLLIHYPKPIHEEVIIEHLWPGADPQKGKARLRTTAMDLRKSLDPYRKPNSDSYVANYDEHYSLKLPSGSEVDFHEFQRAVKERTESPLNSRLTEEHLNRLSDCLSMYAGDFLPELPYDDFALRIREKLQSDFLKLVNIMVTHGLEKKQYDQAVRLIHKGLDKDPLWTDGVKKLMAAYAESGRLLEAWRSYRDYEQRMKNSLNLPPDEEVKEYFDALVKPTTV